MPGGSQVDQAKFGAVRGQVILSLAAQSLPLGVECLQGQPYTGAR